MRVIVRKIVSVCLCVLCVRERESVCVCVSHCVVVPHAQVNRHEPLKQTLVLTPRDHLGTSTHKSIHGLNNTAKEGLRMNRDE